MRPSGPELADGPHLPAADEELTRRRRFAPVLLRDRVLVCVLVHWGLKTPGCFFGNLLCIDLRAIMTIYLRQTPATGRLRAQRSVDAITMTDASLHAWLGAAHMPTRDKTIKLHEERSPDRLCFHSADS